MTLPAWALILAWTALSVQRAIADVVTTLRRTP